MILNFHDLLNLRGFMLSDSDKVYYLQRDDFGGYELWTDRETAPMQVGKVIRMTYSIKIMTRVAGLMLAMEVAYEEIKHSPSPISGKRASKRDK